MCNKVDILQEKVDQNFKEVRERIFNVGGDIGQLQQAINNIEERLNTLSIKLVTPEVEEKKVVEDPKPLEVWVDYDDRSCLILKKDQSTIPYRCLFLNGDVAWKDERQLSRKSLMGPEAFLKLLANEPL